jgi:hypothetical protein
LWQALGQQHLGQLARHVVAALGPIQAAVGHAAWAEGLAWSMPSTAKPSASRAALPCAVSR